MSPLRVPCRTDSEDEQKNFIPSEGPGIESKIAGREMQVRLAELLEKLKESSMIKSE